MKKIGFLLFGLLMAVTAGLRAAAAPQYKVTEEFSRLVQQIGHEGFDPLHLQHVKKFNLKHYDSFQTLTKEEDRG